MDYRVDVRVRNNRILRYMEQMGYATVGAFCKATGLSPTAVGDIVNLKSSAVSHWTGEWRKTALQIAEALCCEPDDLWTDAQRTMALVRNRAETLMAEAEVSRLFQRPTPLMIAETKDRRDILEDSLRALRPRQEKVVRMRSGLKPYDHEMTLEECANEFGVTRETVRQIEAKAWQKLRGNSRLRECVE